MVSGHTVHRSVLEASMLHTFTLSSLTAAGVYSMNGGCEVYHHISECFLLGVDFPYVRTKWSFLRHLWSVNRRRGSCGRG